MPGSIHIAGQRLAKVMILGFFALEYASAPKVMGQAPGQNIPEPARIEFNYSQVSIETRPLANNGQNAASYVFLSPSKQRVSAPPPGGFTLLVCFHGAGGNPLDFANFFIPLVDSRSDVVVASASTDTTTPDQTAAIVREAIQRDHVNPRHVIILGYSAGGGPLNIALRVEPEMFAGVAAISTPLAFFTPKVQVLDKQLAVYESIGRLEANIPIPEVATRTAKIETLIRNFGFDHALVEMPERSHQMSLELFVDMNKNMMAFFDHAFADFDKAAAKSASPSAAATPKANSATTVSERTVAVRERNVGEPSTNGALPGAYFLVSVNRTSPTPAPGTILLICIPGVGARGEDYAEQWRDLVQAHSNVVVVVPKIDFWDPELYLMHSYAEGKPNPLTLISAIIHDTVARDAVDPGQVFLVGQTEGGEAAKMIFGEHPEWFAGYAGLGTTEPYDSTPDLLRSASGKRLYWAVGTKDEYFADTHDDYAGVVRQLNQYGFGQVLTERPACGSSLPPVIFQAMAEHMVNFFANGPKQGTASGLAQAVTPTFDLVEMRQVNLPLIITTPPNLNDRGAAANPAKLPNPYPDLIQTSAPPPKGSYALVAPKGANTPANGYTLLLCLHGSGDHADTYAARWRPLVNSRHDVLVAVPELDVDSFITGGNKFLDELINDVVDDTVARYHVNPAQVFLVMQGNAALTAFPIVDRHRDLFAGVANLNVLIKLWDVGLSPVAKNFSHEKTPIFYNAGTKLVGDQLYNQAVESFKQADFTDLQTDRPEYGKDVSPQQFTQTALRMMKFFDSRLPAIAHNRAEALKAAGLQPVTPPIFTGTEEYRKIQLPKGRGPYAPTVYYRVVLPAAERTPPPDGYALVVYINPEPASKANFARHFKGFVETRDLVAVDPLFDFDDRDGIETSGHLTTAVINDLVAHNHVNPHKIFLVGEDFGVTDAMEIFHTLPDTFAGVGLVGPSLQSFDFLKPAADQAEKTPLFYARRDNDLPAPESLSLDIMQSRFGVSNYNDVQYVLNLRGLQQFYGFTNIAMERMPLAYPMPPEVYYKLTADMLRFFEQSAQDRDELDQAKLAAQK